MIIDIEKILKGLLQPDEIMYVQGIQITLEPGAIPTLDLWLNDKTRRYELRDGKWFWINKEEE